MSDPVDLNTEETAGVKINMAVFYKFALYRTNQSLPVFLIIKHKNKERLSPNESFGHFFFLLFLTNMLCRKYTANLILLAKPTVTTDRSKNVSACIKSVHFQQVSIEHALKRTKCIYSISCVH